MAASYNVLCLVCMLLAVLSPSLSVFVNIDCGSNASYTDENSIRWTGDDGYIQNGESKAVSFILIPPYVSGQVMTTLRAFPTLKKNCYSINVVKGEKVLARASFFYGNYDGNDSPPTFELQFDGNFWATVNTSIGNRNYYEAIYVTKANSTSICVAQTLPGQIPFISALELRTLDSTMYSHVDPSRALFLAHRANSGTNVTIRYPEDDYDRIWEAETSFLYAEDMKNEAVSIDLSKAEDKPPLAVLQNALVGEFWGMFLRTTIFLRTEDLPAMSAPVYITAYFSEVARLNATDKRSIDVYINEVAYSRQITPPFGSVSVLYITNKTANSNTNISIRGSDDSTLPPLINAYELYSISDTLTDGTNGDDVEALETLQKKFETLQRWSGDQCLPSKFSWEWLQCNTDAPPRVTGLNLSSFGLSGTLPDFSSLTELETIDLHNNSLEGPIPTFLGSLPNLKLLNLADNRFNGSIPSSLSNNKKLVLIVTGNCLAGMSCKQETSRPGPSAPPTAEVQTPNAQPEPSATPTSEAQSPNAQETPRPESSESPTSEAQTPNAQEPSDAPSPEVQKRNAGEESRKLSLILTLTIMLAAPLLSFLFNNF